MQSQKGYLPPKLQESLEIIIESEKLITCSIHIKHVETNGSFIGNLCEIKIKGDTENRSKVLELFVKNMPDGDVNIYSIPHTYKNETFMYTEFRKTINDVQEEANIPVKERYILAKSYASKDFGIIIMENLVAKGYTTLPTQDIVTLKFAELVIQQLAKYHSLAFILKEKRPKFFEEKIKNMKQPFYYGRGDFNEFLKNFSRIGISCLSPEQKKKMEEFLPTTFSKYEKYTQDPTDVWTMVHGDFRQSNVMTKFENGGPSEVILIDYQHSFYGCSIIDFIYFIIAGTDQEFRRNHLEYLKDYYHESMKRFLKLFEMDIENYYPKEEFDRLYKERLDYGLMVAMWLLPVILANKGDVPDVTKIDLATYDFSVSDSIKKRIRDIVDDYTEWGYL